MTTYILIVLALWQMPYRDSQVTPVNLGEFKSLASCQEAGRRAVEKLLKGSSAICVENKPDLSKAR